MSILKVKEIAESVGQEVSGNRSIRKVQPRFSHEDQGRLLILRGCQVQQVELAP